MTQSGQDFVVYAGDAATVQFTVLDQNGNAVDISTVSEITWTARRDLATAVVLTKTKSAGNIVFATSGTDGKLNLSLAIADTSSLTGYYLHQVIITDAIGNPTTVTLGRLQVGRAPVWTYSGDPTSSNKDAIRFLIGDTLVGDPLLQDAEIAYTLALRGSLYGAAAQCCRSLATQMSRQADSSQGELRISYSSRSRNFAKRAEEYELREAISGSGQAWAGGISIADKQGRETDTDRVKPQFNLGMTDSSIPISQGGNELLSGTDEA